MAIYLQKVAILMFRKLDNVFDFKIESMVEEGMKKLRNLDRRPSSRVYRIGVTSDKKTNHYATTEAQMAANSILSTFSGKHIMHISKQNNEIQ